ncbi:MAG: hypothetical protein Kow0026_25330 [Oricola sp.]
MSLSVAGVIVTATLVLLLVVLRAGIVAGLIGSLAFGATAFVTLTSLGGSSPLIYVVFTLILIATAFLRLDLPRKLGSVFRNVPAAWAVLAFMTYSALSAILFPRLFAGDTNVFVSSRVSGGVFEIPLAPVSTNITQAGYLVLSCLTFFAVALTLTRRFSLSDITRGFFLWGWINAILGMVDFLAKYGGAGDILSPIKSANYAMLTDVQFAGFERISGAYSEASAFGSVSLACLAFSYTYWRKRRTRQSFWLSVITLFLLLASTSSTAYVGLAILSIPVFVSILGQMLRKRVRQVDVLIVAALLLGATGFMAVSFVSPRILAPAAELLNDAVIEKAMSASGQERAYWNYASLKSLIDTNGFGVGIGSSRASSWLIAVVSQLGIIGFALIAFQVHILLRGMRGVAGKFDPDSDATLASVRACTLAGLVSSSLVGGSADPGLVFFIALAVISMSRVYISRTLKEDARAAANRSAAGYPGGLRPANALRPAGYQR